MGAKGRRVERPPLDPLSLTIFFPCWNEQEVIEALVRKAVKVGRAVAGDLEVIVVDDGSTDLTGRIADDLSREIPEVRAVHNPRNLGYGAALQRGFREATRNWIFYTDGDGQFDLGEIEKCLPLLEEHDVVSCYRVNRQDPWSRKLNGFAWSTLVSWAFGLRLRDVDAAFKIYPRSFVEAIELRSTGNLIDAEMLAKARNRGLSIVQRGATHLPRRTGVSTGGSLRSALRAFQELFLLYRHIRNDRQ